MKNYGFIYITTNIKNGKQYIGQTYYRDKMDPNYFGSGKAIKRAIKKNGIESFTREIIFEAFDKDGLDWAETYFIKIYDAVKSRKFYNISPGGRASLGFTGKTHTPERNAKLSEKMLQYHPRAKPITVENVEYKTIADAIKHLGFSASKIQKWVETGIHPLNQIHGQTGVKKKILSPTTKTWSLLKDDGTIISVVGLRPWCREQGLNPHHIFKSKDRGFYMGYKLLT